MVLTVFLATWRHNSKQAKPTPLRKPTVPYTVHNLLFRPETEVWSKSLISETLWGLDTDWGVRPAPGLRNEPG